MNSMSEEMRGNSILFEREGGDKEREGTDHYLPYTVHIDFLPFFSRYPFTYLYMHMHI